MVRLFVTGMYRSGTTLIEKLLHSFHDVSVASQPLPLLYIEAKQAFLSRRGHDDGHPLGHLFLEDRYSAHDFHQFLDGHVLDADALNGLMTRLEAAAGFQSRRLLDHAGTFSVPASFNDIRHQAVDVLAGSYGKADARWHGSKEVICEEYIPYLLDRDEHVVLIVRNPHDVLASVYLGRGPEFAGNARPVLHHVRTWRKSVAFGLAYEAHPRFSMMRYEDLVTDPGRAMGPIADLLGCENMIPPTTSNLRDQGGSPWRANSSFESSNPAASRNRLPMRVSAYIDVLCRPELQSLGYPVASAKPDWAMLAQIEEPLPVTDPVLAPGYSTDPVHLEQERQRLAFIDTRRPPTDVAAWFIHEATYRRLIDVVREAP